MPTVILLDVSLSMSRPVGGNEEYTRRHLAIHGLNDFFDCLAVENKLEHVSLVIFSSLYEQVVPFTRDYSSIKTALLNVEEFDKTCIEVGLLGAASVISDEWGFNTQSQIIIITDGSTGVGKGSLKPTLESYEENKSTSQLPLKFPCDIHILCLADPSDKQDSVAMYERLIALNGQGGQVFLPEDQLSLDTAQKMFQRFRMEHFMPFHGTLMCGHLSCAVNVYPRPKNYDKLQDFEHVHLQVSEEIEIIGFLDIADMASPPFISRHILLPISTIQESTDDTSTDGKTPSFTVLLHGSLKVENMVAICQVGHDWYGMIYSHADPHKKRSNLMLSIFEPGNNPLPWLGKLSHLAPHQVFPVPPYGDEDNKTPFPVKITEKRSYAHTHVGWIKPTGLQADIQKVLRHARKLPEKLQHFYKELNRVRKAALSHGFTELLDALSAMLDRECTLLPGTAHPDAALQLSHAASALRTEMARDITQFILPMSTKYSSLDGR